MKAFLFTFEALLFTVSCQKSHIFLAREGVETNKIYLLKVVSIFKILRLF